MDEDVISIRAEEKYRTILRTTRDGFWIADRQGRFLEVNDAYCRLIGYSQAELLTMSIPDVEAVERPEETAQHIHRIMANGRDRFESRHRCKDGRMINVEVSVNYAEVNGGQLFAFLRDITEHQRAEEALRRSEEEANRLARENVTVAEIGRIISSTLNIDEVYALFSAKVKTLLEYDRIVINLISEDGATLINRYAEGDPAPGRDAGQVFPIAGTLTEAMIQERKGFMINSQNENEIGANYPGLLPEFQAGSRSFLSVPLISRDKAIGGLHFRSRKFRSYSEKDLTLAENIANQIAGAIANAQLYAEFIRAEKEKKALEEQLLQSQKMEAVGRLAGGIAHDFNNLLTVIKGYSQLSITDLKDGDPFKGNMEGIQTAADRATELTRQLLAFSRRQILEMKVLDLNAVLRNLDKMLHRIIGEDIELVTLSAEGLGRVKADSGWIEQIIMNLAVNARDAMPEGGKLTIETANVELDETYARRHIAVTPGRFVMLSVSDTGVGMTPEVKEKVFEPFFTTKEKGRGTGLGLSTVYGIVKQSGGSIWVYSEPGKGSTFKIYLPRVDEPLEERRQGWVKGDLPRSSETILLVEDSEEVLKLTSRVLEAQGYTVLQSMQGSEALKIFEARKNAIHLILTDVVMPQMSGRQLIEQCRRVGQNFRVLYMSGYTDNAIAHHGILEEGIDYIQKPFTVQGLAKKVREVLDKNTPPMSQLRAV